MDSHMHFQVGNQAFADYFDSLGMSATRVNNKEDPVPVLPPIQILNYHHVSGEIHIRDDNVWVSCPGKSMHWSSKGSHPTIHLAF